MLDPESRGPDPLRQLFFVVQALVIGPDPGPWFRREMTQTEPLSSPVDWIPEKWVIDVRHAYRENAARPQNSSRFGQRRTVVRQVLKDLGEEHLVERAVAVGETSDIAGDESSSRCFAIGHGGAQTRSGEVDTVEPALGNEAEKTQVETQPTTRIKDAVVLLGR